jgi:hypothetical protein
MAPMLKTSQVSLIICCYCLQLGTRAIRYSTFIFMFILLTVHHNQDFGGVFFMNWIWLIYYSSDTPSAFIEGWKKWKGDEKLILKLPIVATAATTSDCDLIFKGWYPAKIMVLALISVSETSNPAYLLYVNAAKPAPLCWNRLFCLGGDHGAFLEVVWKCFQIAV